MKILYVFNLDRDRGERDAEFDNSEQVERWQAALAKFGSLTSVEFNDPLKVVRAVSFKPDLVVNMAEGHRGASREAFVPMVCEAYGVPYTGSGPGAFMVTLDKEWTKREITEGGGPMAVPPGMLISDRNMGSGIARAGQILRFPLVVKPNCEGSSKGIRKDSVVEDADSLGKIVRRTLAQYPGSVLVEQYIAGKDVMVPYLELFRGSDRYGVTYPEILEPYEIVPHESALADRKHFIYDYQMKTELSNSVDVVQPPDLDPDTLEKIRGLCAGAFRKLGIRDVGRIDLRVTPDGTPYFIEANALPAIGVVGQFEEAYRRRTGSAPGSGFDGIVDAIVRSAMRRYKMI